MWIESFPRKLSKLSPLHWADRFCNLFLPARKNASVTCKRGHFHNFPIPPLKALRVMFWQKEREESERLFYGGGSAIRFITARYATSSKSRETGREQEVGHYKTVEFYPLSLSDQTPLILPPSVDPDDGGPSYRTAYACQVHYKSRA